VDPVAAGWGWLAHQHSLPFATLRGTRPQDEPPRARSKRALLDQHHDEPTAAPGDPRSSILAEVSREMVRLYKEQFGRGPTKARTDWAGPDTLITVLEDTLTPAERNLVRLGEHQRVRDMRTFFQYATVEEFCAPIERLTGRRVRGFLSSIDTQVSGLAMETFVLHPEGYEGQSRIDIGSD
jgi:uncharacterized protein YbcI